MDIISEIKEEVQKLHLTGQIYYVSKDCGSSTRFEPVALYGLSCGSRPSMSKLLLGKFSTLRSGSTEEQWLLSDNGLHNMRGCGRGGQWAKIYPTE